jgi:hypothetical protein
VEHDREAVEAEGVAALRAALMAGSRVAEAFRWCWYRHPMFAAVLFTESARRRFGCPPDIRAITAFLAGIRATRDKASGPGFPSREAEALIRAVLGEMFLLESVPPSDFSYPEMGIAVLVGLYREGSFSRAGWDELLRETQMVVADGRRRAPELAMAEDDWYAVGLHDSPFAILGDEPSECE